ncbi:MAG: class I SAM-dependent methyltransferase [Saprospiraceae bacterium]|nr:class I SAM-dependent methyltransferase [Saprospiraceae bacterium]
MSSEWSIPNIWNKIRWTVYLPIYDWVVNSFGPYRALSIENLHLKAGDKILISGAGSGLDLQFLPDSVEITAIDITPGMIALLKNKARRQGKNVEAMVMDGMQLQLEDNSYDHVILHLILAVIPDPVKCIREAERVLKPGGTIVVFDKFIPVGQKPGIVRKVLNVIFQFLATSVNRDIDKIVAHTGLQKQKDQPVAWAGLFRAILLYKPTA